MSELTDSAAITAARLKSLERDLHLKGRSTHLKSS